jgi:uncharacterized oxidoreductase
MTEQTGVTAPEATVRALIEDIFGALGFTTDERAVLAETLLEASRAGYHSHGVMRIPTFVGDTRAGMITPAASPAIVNETAAAVLIDAHRCLGPISTAFAIESATAKAREAGIGCALVKNGNDVARLGAYVGAPARDGLITLLLVNDAGGGACVAPFGGAAPFLSTNPLAAGIPRGPGEPPLVIDLSTSVVALGKVRMAMNQGDPVPEGWLIDSEGEPTTDPTAFFKKPREAALLPLGGATDGHKGFLLSLIVEALAGALTGAGMSGGHQDEDRGNGLFVLMADPKALGTAEVFAREMAAFVGGLKAVPPAAGSDGVRLPGEALRDAPGGDLPIDGPTWAKITTILEELSVTTAYVVHPAA